MVHGTSNGARSMSKLRQMIYHRTVSSVALWTLITGLIVLMEENVHATQLPVAFLSSTVGTILGLAVALLTGSAMTQHRAGYQAWSEIRELTRKFAQGVWFHVASDIHAITARFDSDDDSEAAITARRDSLQIVLEQRAIIDLTSAYAVAIKHSLRGEPGAYYADLYPSIQHLPRFAGSSTGQDNLMPIWRQSRDLEFGAHDVVLTQVEHLGMHSSTGSSSTTVGAAVSSFSEKTNARDSILPMYTTDRPLAPARIPQQTGITDYIPIFGFFASVLDWAIRTPAAKFRRSLSMHKRWVKNTESTVPSEIANYVHAHLESFVARGYFKAGWDGMVASCVNELQAVEARLIHIRNTRLAFAYQAHLRICTWLYLIIFPLTNYESLGQWVILAEAVIAFIFLGMLDIAREVENPFGYDANDIDQDAICAQIRSRSAQITAHIPGASNAYVFAPTSQPLAPMDMRPAAIIMADAHDSGARIDAGAMQQTMLQGWRKINAQTRGVPSGLAV